MPTAVGMFFPLGFFLPETASSVWFLLNAAGLNALVFLSIPQPRSSGALLAGMLFAVFFPPFFHHILLGQISILSALFLMAAVGFAEQRRDWAVACFLAAGLPKPQIGFLILLGLGQFYFQRGGIESVIRFGVKTLTAALAMCLPLFFAEPNWMPDWLASLRANQVAWMHPSILFPLRQALGTWGYLPWACLTAGTLWVVCWLWKTQPPRAAAIWSLALTLLITPYVWSWDFVLLLPLFIYAFRRGGWQQRIMLAAGYVLGWAGMAALQLSANDHNSRFWWAPLWFLLLVGAAQMMNTPRAPRRSTTAEDRTDA